MRFILVLIGVLLFSTIGLAAPLDVSWQAVGSPGFVKIDGAGGKANCALDDKGLGECSCALDDFDTGIAKRNEHMKDKYLETGKWPKATLKVASAGDGKFAGTLTLKGVAKPVSGTYALKEGVVDASFPVSLADYPIGVPSFLGVTVAKDVTVHVVGKVK